MNRQDRKQSRLLNELDFIRTNAICGSVASAPAALHPAPTATGNLGATKVQGWVGIFSNQSGAAVGPKLDCTPPALADFLEARRDGSADHRFRAPTTRLV